ncbi:hypothetical protein CDL12_09959 [Handroanthus impetiginosus]|uniref:Uncharacterized protein n=1 Tax=Handroanthus impetiginosus TaxID=429701 RepID=A0A2G9HIM9_9LAMI|nr:hypothetical protein CDL12_09959 [Handroanthus impetiginosus]
MQNPSLLSLHLLPSLLLLLHFPWPRNILNNSHTDSLLSLVSPLLTSLSHDFLLLSVLHQKHHPRSILGPYFSHLSSKAQAFCKGFSHFEASTVNL